MSGYTRDDLAVMFEWDWAYTPAGEVLHHVASFTFDPEYETSAEGVAACGVRSRFAIPGLFSRMGRPRCRTCCRRLAIAYGVGSPKNDALLRSWVEARRAARHPDSETNEGEGTRSGPPRGHGEP